MGDDFAVANNLGGDRAGLWPGARLYIRIKIRLDRQKVNPAVLLLKSELG